MENGAGELGFLKAAMIIGSSNHASTNSAEPMGAKAAMVMIELKVVDRRLFGLETRWGHDQDRNRDSIGKQWRYVSPERTCRVTPTRWAS